ncbi:MAG: MmcQ/YjbR family DNA-binding protein [Oscillospiraceae bacterium]
MTRQELIDHCLAYPGAVEDYPFSDRNSTVLRHGANRKWFALIFQRGEALCINLKCNPMEADFLRRTFSAVTPAWHMNKTHWNTVVSGGDVSDGALLDMIARSFDLTKPHRKKHPAPQRPADGEVR